MFGVIWDSLGVESESVNKRIVRFLFSMDYLLKIWREISLGFWLNKKSWT